MQLQASSPEDYLEQLPEARREGMTKLRATILQNLPSGFEETIIYGMIGYVVPRSIYPSGYHTGDQPLPFVNIASQKNYISLYHYGLYADEKLLQWFRAQYAEQCQLKLDMGKSCIRFSSSDRIPYVLIGQLMQKMGVEDWIQLYEKQIKK
ncbi:MAG: DUF1801 domain-containing protein [Sediminicola sp.]